MIHVFVLSRFVCRQDFYWWPGWRYYEANFNRVLRSVVRHTAF